METGRGWGEGVYLDVERDVGLFDEADETHDLSRVSRRPNGECRLRCTYHFAVRPGPNASVLRHRECVGVVDRVWEYGVGEKVCELRTKETGGTLYTGEDSSDRRPFTVNLWQLELLHGEQYHDA